MKAPPQGRTGLAPGHATARALAQQHVPGNSCHLVYIQGVTGGTCCAPAPSARARYEFGLAPLSLSTTATLSGSHVKSGARFSPSPRFDHRRSGIRRGESESVVRALQSDTMFGGVGVGSFTAT